MSLFFRRGGADEYRSGGPIPTQLIPSRVANAGPVVNPTTASGIVAYGASVNLLASIVSMLPVDLFGPDGSTLPKPDLLVDPGGEGYGWQDWAYSLVGSIGYRGNAVALKHGLDKNGRPSVLPLIAPDTADVKRDERTGLTE